MRAVVGSAPAPSSMLVPLTTRRSGGMVDDEGASSTSTPLTDRAGVVFLASVVPIGGEIDTPSAGGSKGRPAGHDVPLLGKPSSTLGSPKNGEDRQATLRV